LYCGIILNPHSNLSFINIVGEDAKSISDVIPGLTGADLKTLLHLMFITCFLCSQEDQPVVSKDVRFDEKMLNISIFPIKKNKMCGAIIRDLYSPEYRRRGDNQVSEVMIRILKWFRK